MRQPDGFEPREECVGEHEFHPHEHGHVPAEHGWQRCSGRYRCVRCERWSDGELCDPATMGQQRQHGQEEPPALVCADVA